MDCPACHTALVQATHEGLLHWTCPAGHGRFFTHDTLREAASSTVADRSEAEEQAALTAQKSLSLAQVTQQEKAGACPQCGGEMSKLNYAYQSGVVIDTCRDHGVWLDAGELERIEAWSEGTNRIDPAERDKWRVRLAEVERQHDKELARTTASVHWGPVGYVVNAASRWWYARDDAKM